MKIIIGTIFISLVFSVRGQNETCKTTANGLNVCEKTPTLITRVTAGENFKLNEGILEMEFNNDVIIGPRAFETVELRGFLLEMPYTYKRNRLALPSLILHPEAFVRSSNISRIFIIRANVNLIGGSFNSMEQLPYLRFMYCGFTEVPTAMLQSTPNLDELSFENNYLRAIRPYAFAMLKNLRELHLEGNGITSLEVNSFFGLDKLKVLNVGSNHFAAVSGIFNGLSRVTRLDIDSSFDENGFNIDILRDVPALNNIRMGNNNITSLEPDMFAIVPKLGYISLYGNNIASVPKGVFDKLKSLFMLHLAANKIESIEPGAFSGLNMTILYLLDNMVDKVIETDTFSGLSAREINLEQSNIKELKPRAFNGSITLEIDLSRNHLMRIDTDDFSGLDTQTLDLRDNYISSIAANAFKNAKVKKLILSGNPIPSVDSESWGLPASTEILK